MTALALVDRLRALPAEDRKAILARCTARQLAALRWGCWRRFWARLDVRDPSDPRIGRGQLPPDMPWTWWANIGGRGSGKTRTCAEWVTEEALRLGRGCVFMLIGPNPDHARKTMIEDERSGLRAVCPPWGKFDFKSSVEGGVVRWASGALGYLYGMDKPAKGRGPNACRAWIDDPAAAGVHGKAALDVLLPGLRLRAPDGSNPRGVVSSTPIDSELLDYFLEGLDDGKHRKVKIVYSLSWSDDNRANLSDTVFDELLAEYVGTEWELQERFGKRIKTRSAKVFAGIAFDKAPVRVEYLPTDLVALAIWVDPATSSTTYSCEVGVVVLALDARGHVYIVRDLSKVMDSTTWPDVVIEEAWRLGREHLGVPLHLGIEVNIGGNMGPGLLEKAEQLRRLQEGGPGVSVLEVRKAVVKPHESKARRATPVVQLARRSMFHLLPDMPLLERQLRELDDTEGGKRDRADAAVHGVLDLALGVYPLGGAAMPPGPVGPVPQGSVIVGAVLEAPEIARAQPFQMGMPAGWSGR